MTKSRNKRHFGWRMLLLGLILPAILSGCGAAVEPWEILCESGICWDMSGVDYIYVNDDPIVGKVPPDDAHGARIATTKGYTYSARVRVTSGACHTYVSPNSTIDPKHNQLTDYYSNAHITFTAEKEVYYLLIADTGGGCDYSVRVISYDENRDPLPGTTYLPVNGGPLSYRLIPGETLRFVFNGVRGYDYTVRVSVLYGKADTFLSVIPSVDSDVYELSDIYSNSGIRFRATETAKYYIAVMDHGGSTGSDVAVEVTSP